MAIKTITLNVENYQLIISETGYFQMRGFVGDGLEPTYRIFDGTLEHLEQRLTET